MRRRRLAALCLVVVVVSGLGAGHLAAPGDARSTAPVVKSIATVTTSDFRLALTARKVGGGGAPSAKVTATIFQRSDGRWQRSSVHVLPGTYFWKTVTGRRSVCRLEVRTATALATSRPVAIVQLLITPSIGCGTSHRYAL